MYATSRVTEVPVEFKGLNNFQIIKKIVNDTLEEKGLL